MHINVFPKNPLLPHQFLHPIGYSSRLYSFPKVHRLTSHLKNFFHQCGSTSGYVCLGMMTNYVNERGGKETRLDSHIAPPLLLRTTPLPPWFQCGRALMDWAPSQWTPPPIFRFENPPLLPAISTPIFIFCLAHGSFWMDGLTFGGNALVGPPRLGGICVSSLFPSWGMMMRSRSLPSESLARKLLADIERFPNSIDEWVRLDCLRSPGVDNTIPFLRTISFVYLISCENI